MKRSIFAIVGLALLLSGCNTQESPAEIEPARMPEFTGGEVATFAGGCFWCMEPPFEAQEGTLEVVVGYSGGGAESANYKDVVKGTTEHREAVQINYNPEVVSYEDLLMTFFMQIDPTDDGGQFADRGFQYTTAIYHHNDEQKMAAADFIKSLNESGKFEKPVVTEVIPFETFFLAEEYHQNFYIKSSEHYERYAKGSGRKGFIEENWAREDALKFSR